MSDEEFEALPDWFNVENDAESTTGGSCSSRSSMEMASGVSPAVYVPTGYPGVLAQESDSTKTRKLKKPRRSKTAGKHHEQF
jgi:hypothetical protein